MINVVAAVRHVVSESQMQETEVFLQQTARSLALDLHN